MRSCNYPTYLEVQNGDYTITESDCGGPSIPIYSGRCYNPSGSVSVDLSEVARNRLGWGNVVFPSNQGIESTDYQSRILAIGSDGGSQILFSMSSGIKYSTDGGITFADGDAISATINSIAFNPSGTRAVVAGSRIVDYNVYYTNNAGGNFIPVNSVVDAISSCRYCNNVFVLGSQDGSSYYYSPDGITYTKRERSFSGSYIYDVVYFSGYYCFAVGDYVSVSPILGTSDSFMDNDLGASVLGLATDGTTIVCVGSGGMIKTAQSPTGPYTGSEVGYSTINGICFGDRFVAVNSAGEVCESAGGTSWKRTQIYDSPLDCITYANGAYWIGARDGHLIKYVPASSIEVLNDFVKDFEIQGRSTSIAYDYNTKYVSELGPFRVCNNPIRNEVCEGQAVALTTQGEECNQSKELQILRNGTAVDSWISVDRGLRFWANATGDVGDTCTLRALYDGSNYDVDYKIVGGCIRYIIYYINKSGGLDWLLVKGNTTVTYVNTPYEIDTAYDRSSPSNHQHKTIQNTARRQWSMYLGDMNTQQAAMIDEVKLSPALWVYDRQEDLYFAANLTENSFAESKFIDLKKPVNYQITLLQSQEIIRK